MYNKKNIKIATEKWSPAILGYHYLLKKPRRSNILYYSEMYKKYGLTLVYYPNTNNWMFIFSIYKNIISYTVKNPEQINSIIRKFLKSELKLNNNNFIKKLFERCL